MGAARTVRKRTDQELLREYNALFGDKSVQKVMRYLAVRDELFKRHPGKAIFKMAADQRRIDLQEGGNDPD